MSNLIAIVNNIPKHWVLSKIKYAFDEIGSGTTPPTSDLEYYEDGVIPWITTSELRENIIYQANQNLNEAALEKFSALKVYPPDTVLIAMYGATIGRLGVLGVEATVNQAVCALSRAKEFIPEYVFYHLQATKEILVSNSSGGGQPNINAEKVKEHSIYKPPLREQRSIIEYIRCETVQIDNLIQVKENLLAMLIEKRQALITQAVTRGLDSTVSLKTSGVEWLGDVPEHWEFERTRWLFQERNDRSETGEEEMLTVSHLTGVTPRSEKDVNMFEAESNEGYKVCYPGDLVINTLWAWMGAMGVAPLHGIVSPAYHVYTPTSSIESAYIDVIVRLPVFASEVTRYSKGVWSSRLRLYPEGFYEVYLPVPPLEEQRQIVNHIKNELGKLNTLQTAAERTITLLKERRSALITAAVTGQIDIPQLHAH